MFKNERPKFYTSKIGTDDLDFYQNNEVIKLFTSKHKYFEYVYIPEGYNVAFVLIHESMKDSFEDMWKIEFFKKAMNNSGTITLDNIEEFNESDKEYEIYKSFDGSFEDVINVSCDIISKHKLNILEEGSSGNSASETGNAL